MIEFDFEQSGFEVFHRHSLGQVFNPKEQFN